MIGLSLALLGGAVYAAFSRTLIGEVDSELRDHADDVLANLKELSEPLSQVDRAGYEGGRFTLVVTSTGQVLANPQSTDPRPLIATDVMKAVPRFITTSLDGEPVRVHTRVISNAPWSGDVLVTGESIAAEETALRQLLLVMLAVGSVVLTASCMGAWFLASKALDPIQQALHRQQEFAADASHELRTPLMVLRSASDLLDQHRHEPLEANADLLDDIRHEVEHLERLVGELLTLARADLGQLELAVADVDLSTVAIEGARRVATLAEERNIRLEVATFPTPLMVEADPDRLDQVLLILLDNALKHTSSGGRITISTRCHSLEGVLQVSDTGDGIAPEHLGRVFDRFYRADQAREETGNNGAGLGLAIAQTIVQAHGGRLALASTPGHGTAVSLYLELAGTVRPLSFRGIRSPRKDRWLLG